MDELQKAMAEFSAKQGVTQCEPAGTKKAYQDARRESWQAQETRQANNKQWGDAWDRAEHNAENKRFDSEGVFYIGGKQ